ncbi:MAG TPA: DNA recombination protein RmuC [Holophagaceae bacterium]|nr:DNA recombination protein RmuC [Holophagaceae bacterium]
MTLLTALAALALLAAVIAAVGAWRRPAADAAPFDALRLDMAARLGELKPLHEATAGVRRDLEGLKNAQSEALALRFQELSASIQNALREARLEQGAQLGQVQEKVEARLLAIQKANDEKLEQMRRTVDEKLHDTLEKRLGESFKLVSERLELVQKGLGEMQSLANDVGGLKRALTNVKTRGVMGEAQLGALLEQFLAPGQYAANVKIRPRSNEIVEFAVKLPGGAEGETVWLPVDAKFPTEDYQRLMEAYEAGDLHAVERAAQALESRLMGQARDIRDKYIAPPHSTDFALLFLPFEGLYAEALRRPGLLERLQRECKVTIVGPTTLTAFLNSLQVGFRTLAISRQSSEVWKLLGAIRTDFGKFGETLEALDKKLDEAKSKLGAVSDRSRILQDKLKKVDALPEAEAREALGVEGVEAKES